MNYQKAVKKYFIEKGQRFLKKYKDLESLKQAHNEALREWSTVKDDIKHHKIYHKHANLSTAFKTIQKKLK